MKNKSKNEKTYRHSGKTNILVFTICIICLFFIIIEFCVDEKIMAMQEKENKEILIVIDPGHGGFDPGKIGVTGTKEKNINLEIALMLKNKFVENGVNVLMTRDKDICLADENTVGKRKNSDMRNRVNIINSANPSLMISIHQNSYISADVKGAQVFYYYSSNESKKLAERIQKKIIELVDSNNKRMAKETTDLYILKKSNCPGVIVECGFLSCKEEEEKLVKKEYQEKIVNAIYSATLDYISNK